MPTIWKLPTIDENGVKRRVTIHETLRPLTYDESGERIAGVNSPDADPPVGGAVVIDENGDTVIVPYEEDSYSFALTTVARIKTRLAITSSQHDTALDQIVHEVSARFERYLNRTIVKADQTDVYPVRNGRTLLTLKATPVTSIASVKQAWHGSALASASAMQATEYMLESAQNGQLRFMSPLVSGSARTPTYVQVEYRGGMALDTTDFMLTWPDIALAAEIQAAYQFERKMTPGGNASFEGGGSSFTGDLELLPNVRHTLDLHRRLT